MGGAVLAHLERLEMFLLAVRKQFGTVSVAGIASPLTVGAGGGTLVKGVVNRRLVFLWGDVGGAGDTSSGQNREHPEAEQNDITHDEEPHLRIWWNRKELHYSQQFSCLAGISEAGNNRRLVLAAGTI